MIRVEKTKVDGTLPVGSEVSIDITFPTVENGSVGGY
jgi:hypothetical protein